MKRIVFIGAAIGAAIGASSPARATAAGRTVTIYRDTGCGCCEGWAAALTSAGYIVRVEDLEHAKRLSRFSIAPELSSCHTAVLADYLVEGHVPLPAVAKLLKERPKTKGVALPGMPTGTPGMPGPAVPVQVVLLDAPNRVFYSS